VVLAHVAARQQQQQRAQLLLPIEHQVGLQQEGEE
jgi:hypothetical protein